MPEKVEAIRQHGFAFAVTALEHPHIYGMTQDLIDTGAELKYIYDADKEKVKKFREQFPQAKPLGSLDEMLQCADIQLVAAAGVPNERAATGIRVLESGKDYFVDKTAFTTMEQLEETKKAVARTGRKFIVFLSEQFTKHNQYVKSLITDGCIGNVVQVINFGPHRLNEPSRPKWFFIKEQYGGIICDLGTHQIAEFLYYADAKNAKVLSSQVGNYKNPNHPELEDFGDATLVSDNGVMNYLRVDWLTPDGLGAWGDYRSFILGTTGYIEIRKAINIGTGETGCKIYLVTRECESVIDADALEIDSGLGEMVLDCINRTENSLPQEFIFTVSELCIQAQAQALRVK